MIHELREYRIDAPIAEEYFTLLRELAMPLRGDAFGKLIGNWLVPGHPLTFYHLWGYGSMGERERLRATLAQLDRWKRDFLPAAAMRIVSQRLTILRPYDSKGLSPDDLSDAQTALARFTTIRCRTGTAPAVAAAVSGAAAIGRRFVWIEEMPDPNAVHCLGTRDDAITDADPLRSLGAVHLAFENWNSGPC